MPASETTQGGCSCGALRYELDDTLAAVLCCHCTVCQRRTGSAFGISVIASTSAFRQLSGETTSWATEQASETGNTLTMQACSACGTRCCWAHPSSNPRIVVVFGGTLDDTSNIRPTAHIHTASKQPWITIPDGVYESGGEPDWRQVFSR